MTSELTRKSFPALRRNKSGVRVFYPVIETRTAGKTDLMTAKQSQASAQKAVDATETNREKVSSHAGTTRTLLRPMTGEEYIESLRDGREVYLYGDRVKDVTTHPAKLHSPFPVLGEPIWLWTFRIRKVRSRASRLGRSYLFREWPQRRFRQWHHESRSLSSLS